MLDLENRLILDVDDVLIAIETIVNKYVIIPEGARFIKGYRDPILEKNLLEKYRTTNNMVSDKPFHPYVAGHILKDYFYFKIVDTCELRELTNTNPLMKDGVPVTFYDSVMCDTNADNIILHYIPDIISEDLVAIRKLLKHAGVILSKIIDKYPNNLYVVNIESQHVVIERGEDIRAYRFNEALEYEKLIKEVNDDR